MGGQIQVISGDGTYAGDAVEDFLQGHQVSNSGVGYTTVAIMGPQSSGKSTLLNAVVRFRFRFQQLQLCLSVSSFAVGPVPGCNRSMVCVLRLQKKKN